MRSASTPVISATLSRGKSAREALRSSIPSVRSVMKASSASPSSTITRIIPMRSATSVPGRCCRKTSATSQSSIRFGLATISFAPLLLAFFTRRLITGWAWVVFVPMAKMQAASAISLTELVMAPLPNVVASPATVGLCQRRAQ